MLFFTNSSPRYSQWASHRLENWFHNSLKQLSAVQQRQVGLILGASVADAAVRPWYLSMRRQIANGEEACLVSSTLASSPAEGSTDPSPFFYGLASTSTEEFSVRSDLLGEPASSEATRPNSRLRAPYAAFASPVEVPQATGHDVDMESGGEDTAQPVRWRHHSFTHSLFASTVRAMALHHGAFPHGVVMEMWVEEAARCMQHPFLRDEYASAHGTLLHTLNTLIAVPAIYPFASDTALHEFCLPLLDFMHDEHSTAASPLVSAQSTSSALVVLSVVLRFLQANPSPLRNTALQVAALSEQAPFLPLVSLLHPSLPQGVDAGTTLEKAQAVLLDLFPVDVQRQCFSGEMPNTKGEMPEDGSTTAHLRDDAQIIREALSIVARHTSPCAATTPSTSFAEAVEAAISFNGNTPEEMGDGGKSLSAHATTERRALAVCHRAMLVGALVGSRYGARAIPPRWLSATVDHAAMAGFAIEVSQGSWNPVVEME